MRQWPAAPIFSAPKFSCFDEAPDEVGFRVQFFGGLLDGQEPSLGGFIGHPAILCGPYATPHGPMIDVSVGYREGHKHGGDRGRDEGTGAACAALCSVLGVGGDVPEGHRTNEDR